jgi:hypothetical protein
MLHMKDTISKVQFGFRPNIRTADSLFIFKTVINKYFNLLKNFEKCRCQRVPLTHSSVDSKIICYIPSVLFKENLVSVCITRIILIVVNFRVYKAVKTTIEAFPF